MIEIKGIDSSVESVFVGMRDGEYVVATPPSSNEKEARLSRGDILDIKFIFKDQLLGFQTKFIEMISDPVTLMLVECPNLVQSRERRAHKRINCFISAKVEFVDEKKDNIIKGVIKDISKSGCRCLFNVPKDSKDLFSIDEDITIRCEFPGIPGEQEAAGIVRGVNQQDVIDMVEVRMEFLNYVWWVPPYN
jgi:c-di-GMP-binding flagellar brake protein YcgR